LVTERKILMENQTNKLSLEEIQAKLATPESLVSREQVRQAMTIRDTMLVLMDRISEAESAGLNVISQKQRVNKAIDDIDKFLNVYG